MTSSTPAARRDEDLPGVGEDSGRRQGASAGTRAKGPRKVRRNPRTRGARRTLLALLALVLAIFGGIGAAHQWGKPPAELSPLLGLDLAGGRQIVIAPITEGGQAIGTDQLDQAIDIIRRRIDGGGVAEAEVSRMGGNISVAIPGNPTPDQLEALSRSSQMRFRPVLLAQGVLPAGQEQPTQRTLPLPPSVLQEQLKEQQRQIEDLLEQQNAEETTAPGDGAEQTDENRGGERIPTSADASSDAGSIASAASTVAPGVPAGDSEGVTPTEEPATTPPANPSDLAQITPELQAAFQAADCADPDLQDQVAAAPADEPIVVCSIEGDEKFILGPAEISGGNLTDAIAAPEQLQGGAVSGRWVVNLTFDDVGREAFTQVTQRLFSFPQGSAQNRFAMVLDGEVISAPTVQAVISGGTATISGTFTADTAQTLANQLKFGALPMSFDVQTSEQISPTLGGEQLRYGILAGVIGLLLVFVFMLVQYHALGLVAIASLLIAALLAYGSVTLLGWANNFRLTMAGVTGLIVAIGITADSFIVYFERIRDEVRSGRPLRYAVDTGWERARRTLIISDVVNLIAAAVLYFLSEAGVKAFAFTLGLTTFIDLVVVFMFTHPIVSILANTRFFGEGRKWSGMEPERLGAKRSAYLGRGQVREPDVLSPGRRRHSREELEGGVV